MAGPLSTGARASWLLRRLKRSDRRESWFVLGMLVSVLAVILLTTFMQVRLNQWQGSFYNSLQERDVSEFIHQLGRFFVLVFSLLGLGVAQTWITETMKVRSRRWLTSNILDSWLLPRRAYLLRFAGEVARNPDQRITEDARRMADQSIGLLVGLIQSTLLLVSFVTVLWTLSAEIVFVHQGESFTVPGYMVWCALAFTFVGSGLTYLVGRPLIQLNAGLYAREGEFRTLLVNINEQAEGISLNRGELDERAAARQRLGTVIAFDQALADRRARLTWVTAGYGWVGIVAPIVLAAPGYFSGSMSLGELMMVVGAFVQVQNSLRWFIDHYPAIAEWQAGLIRVTSLLVSLDGTGCHGGDDRTIAVAAAPEGKLVLEGLTVCAPGEPAQVSFEQGRIEVARGDRIQFVGLPGSGKTALFMALAELWPWGGGAILQPDPFKAMFLPERPYIPLGSLRHALAYPAAESDIAQSEIASAMRAVGLCHLVAQSGTADRWERSLPLGDQQRLSIARVLLHRPDWVVLDDSLSALDDQAQHDLLALLGQRLPDAGIIHTSHRRNHSGFYGRTVELGDASAAEPGAVAGGRDRLELAVA